MANRNVLLGCFVVLVSATQILLFLGHTMFSLPIDCTGSSSPSAAQLSVVSSMDRRKDVSSHSSSSCLFVISTSLRNRPNIMSQFASYRGDDTVGLWVNVYDDMSNKNNKTTAGASSSSNGNVLVNVDDDENHSRIITSAIPGLKPALWEHVVPQYTSDYDYLYFLDEDMMFDRSVFAFDQFRWAVERVDAVMATPKIIRMSAEGGQLRARPLGNSNLLRRGQKKKNELQQQQQQQQQQRRRRLQLAPLGLHKEEDVGERYAARVNVVEIGSFYVKTEAWNYFLDNVFIPSSETDCGPDCVWCKVFGLRGVGERFGSIPCLRTLHVGIVHLDTKTYHNKAVSKEKHDRYCIPAVEGYFNKTRDLYGIQGQFLLQCRDNKKEYLSVRDFGLTLDTYR
mmetsp:Transcript_29510/g.65438  ORF Transcript_29510/g.65438 Transcript_29510/m.65438 type:complete len:396 (+) Transcript_29510:57-1244(+)